MLKETMTDLWCAKAAISTEAYYLDERGLTEIGGKLEEAARQLGQHLLDLDAVVRQCSRELAGHDAK